PHDADERAGSDKLPGKQTEMRLCKHIDLQVPAPTEIVIEGRFLPNVRRPEGPFGELMGYYVPVGDNAVFEVLGVSMRPDAIFHSILCGGPGEARAPRVCAPRNLAPRLHAALRGVRRAIRQPVVLHR